MENYTNIEIWKPIIGFESSHEISNHGRVRSLDRITISKNNKRMPFKGKLIQPIILNGYHDVKLNHFTHRLVHRLVAQTFLDNPENKSQVNHIDSNKSNNHYTNLEWNTPSENIAHSVKQGTHPKGETSGTSKLTEKDILEIFKLRIKGLSYEEIARIYNIDQSLVPRILNRKLWKHVIVVLNVSFLPFIRSNWKTQPRYR
jgi:hypothetical protein